MLTPKVVNSERRMLETCVAHIDAVEAIARLSDAEWVAYRERKLSTIDEKRRDKMSAFAGSASSLIDDIPMCLSRVSKTLRVDVGVQSVTHSTHTRWTAHCCDRRDPRMWTDLASMATTWREDAQGLIVKLREADDSGGYSSPSAYTNSEDDTTDEEEGAGELST